MGEKIVQQALRGHCKWKILILKTIVDVFEKKRTKVE